MQGTNSTKNPDESSDKIEVAIGTAAELLGLLPHSRIVQEKLNRRNLMTGIPVICMVIAEVIYRLHLLLTYTSTVAESYRPQAFFIYGMMLFFSFLIGLIFFIDRRGIILNPNLVSIVIYGFMCSHLCYGFQMATEQSDSMNFYNMFFMTAMMTFLLFNVRPVVTMLFCLLFNQIVMRWTSRFMTGAEVSTEQMLMFALWMVSGIRYAMVCGAVRMEEKMERLRDELKTKNRELEYRNEQLRTISGTDALTGACNRQALLNDFDSFLGREICIMMSDIDNFKHYNDSYGHEAGDEVLAGYAALLKKCFVQTQVYRFGGDEFLLVSELKPAEFEETVKYFMKQLETFTTASVREPLTTSAGIVVGKSEDTAILREMFARADHELYRAKHQGKNCYVMEGDFRAAGRTADRKRLDQRRE